MDAKDFIREFGGEKAREVVEAVIDGTTHVTYKQADGLINLKDLKRLVASLDLIKHMGGISEVKRKFRDNGSCHGERMKSLIADHDSIFPDMRFTYTVLSGAQVGSVLQLTPQIDDMGDDSNLDHHVSPFCEVRDV
ncbi:hypothetical protein J799_2268 [Acinetobacter baumannii 45002_6]|uniref:hypothetical protein n=1 Tax=Acinetobacter baumannii TaxID=470 RepID=UPI00044AA906|nr:hypothetical protein [Acinetobacter baumannii]EXS77915.1 hypothetical protein J799_2268 [Acinetobacter baumannii 45002_6]